jgi:hypothetical protein
MFHVQHVFVIHADAALYVIIYLADAADYATVAHVNAIFSALL